MRFAPRWALTTATVAAVASGGLFAVSPAAHAASACSSDCIDVSDVSGTPDGAVFTFATTALSRVKVVVTDLDGTNVYTAKQDDSWGSNYEVTASDSNHFEQGAIYKYAIYATDTTGATWGYSGEFVTLVRTASIHYDNLHVINDGDNIGPGDFAGVARCVDGTPWLPMAPLPGGMLIDGEAELNDGDNLALNDTYSCPGWLGSTIDAQTAVVDDDFNYVDPSPEFWEATSPYAPAWWTSHDYDSSYTAVQVTDPLAPTSTGSAEAPINVTSPTTDTLGYAVGVRYQITGTATFQHSAPMVNLPAPLSAPLVLNPQVTKGYSADVAVVSWLAGPYYPLFSAPTATRVLWKPHSSATWSYTTMLDPTDSSYQLSNLNLGTQYDIAVARVMPGNLLALYSTTGYLTPGVATSPTTITGWSTATVTANVGTTVASTVQVSTGGAPRTVVLQRQSSGQAAWTTASSVLTDGAGHATLKFNVTTGQTRWRLFVPAAGNHDAATSGSRLLIAQTSVAGFNVTTATAKAGTNVFDFVRVSPGVKRAVTLFYRVSGTSAWHERARLTTSATGGIVLPELARTGTYQWKLVVPSDSNQGSAAATAVRTIHGY